MKEKDIMKATYEYNGNLVDSIKIFLISFFLITSIFGVGIHNGIAADGEPRAPKTIWGYVTYCNGGNAVGASVFVSASGYPDETDTTDSSGAYQVDIGPDSGTEWPDGTPFTVTATLGSWSGSNTGTVSGSSTQVDVTLQPPALVADANANPTTIVAGESVDFTGSASGGASPYSWYWDFDGDGTSTEKDPTHTFNTQGTYVCVLEVTDDCGNADTDMVSILVLEEKNLPIPGFNVEPRTPLFSEMIYFNSTSYDNDGVIVNWSWNFGDGNTSFEENTSHQYGKPGYYLVCLSVTDDTGLSNSTHKSIAVVDGLLLNYLSGWNLITFSVQTRWNASDLLTNISNVTMVSWYDTVNETYKTVTIGGGYDFPLQCGWGYFAYVTNEGNETFLGVPCENVSVQLDVGWNMIGWYNEYNTTASSLMENISNSTMISWYDTLSQTYKTRTSAGVYDFIITMGMGVFVYTTEASIWYGEG